MQFQVPQFIDIEDKIFGPLTIKQFVYIAGGLGMSFALLVFLPKFIAWFFIIFVAVFSGALAFYKPNKRPFVFVLESGFLYLISNKFYVWKKKNKEIKKKEIKEKKDDISQLEIPRLSDSKLSDLSWSLDIKEKLVDEINNN